MTTCNAAIKMESKLVISSFGFFSSFTLLVSITAKWKERKQKPTLHIWPIGQIYPFAVTVWDPSKAIYVSTSRLVALINPPQRWPSNWISASPSVGWTKHERRKEPLNDWMPMMLWKKWSTLLSNSNYHTRGLTRTKSSRTTRSTRHSSRAGGHALMIAWSSEIFVNYVITDTCTRGGTYRCTTRNGQQPARPQNTQSPEHSNVSIRAPFHTRRSQDKADPKRHNCDEIDTIPWVSQIGNVPFHFTLCSVHTQSKGKA